MSEMKRLISLALALVMVLGLAACGGKAGGRGGSIRPKDSPEKVVDDFCRAMQAFDFEKMNKCLKKKIDVKDGLNGEAAEFVEKYVNVLRGWAGEMTYAAEGPVVTGETAAVTVQFRYTDASPVFEAVVSEFMSQMIGFVITGMDRDAMKEQLDRILEDVLEEVRTGTAEETVTFQCVDTADGWKIREMPEGAANVLFSNLLNLFDRLDLG